MQNPGAVDSHAGFSHSINDTFSPHRCSHGVCFPESMVKRHVCRGGTLELELPLFFQKDISQTIPYLEVQFPVNLPQEVCDVLRYFSRVG